MLELRGLPFIILDYRTNNFIVFLTTPPDDFYVSVCVCINCPNTFATLVFFRCRKMWIFSVRFLRPEIKKNRSLPSQAKDQAMGESGGSGPL